MDKSILDMVHETAQDLHAAGVMKETTLREFDALCLPPRRVRGLSEYQHIHGSEVGTRPEETQWPFA